MAIQPMEGCDGTRDGRPDTLTERRYERFAKSGVGLIWVEAVAVVQEGRANPRQLFMNEKTLDSFKRLVQMIKETCLQEHGFAGNPFGAIFKTQWKAGADHRISKSDLRERYAHIPGAHHYRRCAYAVGRAVWLSGKRGGDGGIRRHRYQMLPPVSE